MHKKKNNGLCPEDDIKGGMWVPDWTFGQLSDPWSQLWKWFAKQRFYIHCSNIILFPCGMFNTGAGLLSKLIYLDIKLLPELSLSLWYPSSDLSKMRFLALFYSFWIPGAKNWSLGVPYVIRHSSAPNPGFLTGLQRGEGQAEQHPHMLFFDLPEFLLFSTC